VKKTLFLWLFDPVGAHLCVLTVSLIFFPPFIHRWLSRSSIKPNWIREACKRWANNAYCFYRIPLTLIYFLIQPFCFGLAFDGCLERRTDSSRKYIGSVIFARTTRWMQYSIICLPLRAKYEKKRIEKRWGRDARGIFDIRKATSENKLLFRDTLQIL
jgi:hypothetical protein